MDAPYQDIVAQLRFAFPKPVSDRMHDAYFVFSFLRALDQVDALKSAAPMLGRPGHARLRAGPRAAPRGRAARPGDGDGGAGPVPVGHVHLGAPARPDQRRPVADDRQPDRRAAAVDLQPEPGERGDLAPRLAGRGRSRGDDGGADRLRPGACRRRVHLRRHRHAPLRRQDRAREGGARRTPRRPADAGGDRVLERAPTTRA